MMRAPTVDALRHARVPPYGVLVASLAILVVILMGASLAIGYAPLDLVQAFRDVFKGEKTLATLVLTELRLPRALLGCFVGLVPGSAGPPCRG
jgi:iron complex transport system permease protein